MENPASTAAKKIYELTPAQRELIEKLKAHQGSTSDTDFAGRHLDYGGSTWNKIKGSMVATSRSNYFADVKDPEKVFVSLRGSLLRLDRRENRANRVQTETFYQFSPFVALDRAIQACLKKADQADPNRFVAFLAETGCGKTAYGQLVEASDDYVGVVAEARENWRNNGGAALHAICEACGLNMRDLWNVRLMQDALINFMNSHRVVLYLDEGEYFGPSVLNLLKLLLNQSSAVIVTAAIPASYERWTDTRKVTWHEAKQLIRRTHAVIRGAGGETEIPEADAGRFFTDLGYDEKTLGGVAKLAATAANQFGGYDFLTRLAVELANRPEPTPTDVAKAITVTQALMGVKIVPAGAVAKKRK